MKPFELIFYSDEFDYLCFTHAVKMVNQGAEVSHCIDEKPKDYRECDICNAPPETL